MIAAVGLFLALLLAVSAGHKIIAHHAMSSIAARLCGVSTSFGGILLMGAAALEVLAAIALLMPQMRTIGALLAAMVWVAYCAALWRRRGETLDCGCDLVRREKPVDIAAIARPALPAALALALAGLPPAGWTDDAPFAALALLALWFAAAELSALPAISRTGR